MSADEACAHPWITKHRTKHSTLTPATVAAAAAQEEVEPVAQAQAMSERQGSGTENGAAGATTTAASERAAALDPGLVRRLRKFAVRGR